MPVLAVYLPKSGCGISGHRTLTTVHAKVKPAPMQAQEVDRKQAHAAASTSQPGSPPRSRLPADVAARWQREDAEQLADVREQITGGCSEHRPASTWHLHAPGYMMLRVSLRTLCSEWGREQLDTPQSWLGGGSVGLCCFCSQSPGSWGSRGRDGGCVLWGPDSLPKQPRAPWRPAWQPVCSLGPGMQPPHLPCTLAGHTLS